MDTIRMRTLAGVVERIPHFQRNTTGRLSENEPPRDVDGFNMQWYSGKHECGTTACLAGTACWLWWDRPLHYGLDIHGAACEILDLCDWEGRRAVHSESLQRARIGSRHPPASRPRWRPGRYGSRRPSGRAGKTGAAATTDVSAEGMIHGIWMQSVRNLGDDSVFRC